MLSIPHLLIIFLVALVVLGPDKLPQVARMLGRTMAEFRRITSDFRSTIEGEVREMERQTEIRRAAEAARAEVSSALEAVDSVAHDVSQTGVESPTSVSANPFEHGESQPAPPSETQEPVTASTPSSEKLTNG